MRLWILPIIGLLCVLASTPVVAQQPPAAATFREQAPVWEKTLKEAHQALKRFDTLSADELSGARQSLRQLRQEVNARMTAVRDRMASQQELLAALGAAPEDPASEEASIRTQRTALNDTIATIDAELKQANLLVAKADELLLALDEQEKRLLQERLLARSPLLFAAETLSALKGELEAGIPLSEHIALTTGLITVLALLVSATVALTGKLNHFLNKAQTVRLSEPLSRSRFAVVGVSAYAVFLLRFGLVNLDDYPTLQLLLQTASAMCLSVIVYLALGKLHFIADASKRDDDGQESRAGHLWLWNGLRRILRLALLATTPLCLAGYVNLGLYLSFNILVTLASILLFFSLRLGAVRLSRRLSQRPSAEAGSKTAGRKGAAVEADALSPLAIALLEPTLALACMMLALFFWGMTTDDVAAIIERYSTGVQIGDLTIDFASILAGIGLFFTLYFLTRLLQWFLASRVFPFADLDRGIQDAISAITGYVGIILAILVAMGTIGLDMSNLAIVAGALSVGIGFGLQAIFNNFVSGLILLFERPVKVGDWVVVGQMQGTVHKIRVRSTEIRTFQNSSVIVPNSQLISDTVTNWTLHDRIGRVDIPIGVAYGSDTELVKRLLLEVAHAHPEVRRVPESNVFFMNFGESSLDFELRCFIRNIRDIFSVSSDLRFAIDAAFRDHGIVIPFPQRDVHVYRHGAEGDAPSDEETREAAYAAADD